MAVAQRRLTMSVNQTAARSGALTIRIARPADMVRLLDVWLNSVRATHHFLTETDIQHAPSNRSRCCVAEPRTLGALQR